MAKKDDSDEGSVGRTDDDVTMSEEDVKEELIQQIQQQSELIFLLVDLSSKHVDSAMFGAFELSVLGL